MKLDKLTKKELQDLAATKKIKGRSKMGKEELIKALEPFYIEPAPARDALEAEAKKEQNVGYTYVEEKSPIKIKRDEYPIPPYYNKDTIAFMPVDPSKEYVYWEISDYTLNRFKSELRLPETKIVLKIFSSIDNYTSEAASVTVDKIGNWFFNIYAPDTLLWSEIGLIDSNGAFHAILKSNKVRMPSDKVSDIVDQETWMTIGGNLDKLYELSGVGLKDLNSSVTINTEIVKHISQHIGSSGVLKDK